MDFGEMDFLAQRRRRPGVFWGEPSLRALRDEMAGLRCGFALMGRTDQTPLFDGFVRWYQGERLPDAGPHATWWNHLIYLAGGSDREALTAFFSAFEAYLQEQHGLALPETEGLHGVWNVDGAMPGIDEVALLSALRQQTALYLPEPSFRGVTYFLGGVEQACGYCGRRGALPLWRGFIDGYIRENSLDGTSLSWRTHLLSRSGSSDRAAFYNFFHELAQYLERQHGIVIPNHAWDWRNQPS